MEEPIWSPCEDYVHLSQFSCPNILHNLRDLQISRNLKNIIQQFEDINYAIPEGSPVEHHRPEYVGYTALHFAVKAGIEVAVELLLERGADPTLKNRAGYSPIRLAAESMKWSKHTRYLDIQGHSEHTILDLLLSAQVRAGNTANVTCKNGVSHFHLACMMNHEVAVKFFLDVAKVPIDQAVKEDSPILPGYTGLHFAAKYLSFGVFKEILNRGADVVLCRAAGMIPLQLLMNRSLKLSGDITASNNALRLKLPTELNMNEQILEALMSAYKRLKIDFGMSRLHQICTTTRKENLDIIEKIIIKEKADINVAISFESSICPGYTALHFAAHFNIQILILLLKHGANILAKDVEGITPIDICVRNYNSKDFLYIIESVKYLRDIKCTDGTKLLDVIRMISDLTLIKRKPFSDQVTLNSPLWPGNTILHLAVDIKHSKTCDNVTKEVVRECSKFNIVSTQNASGMTPLHLAFRRRKRNLACILMDAIDQNGMTTNPSDFDNLSHLHILSVGGRAKTISDYLNSCNDKTSLNSGIRSGFYWSNEYLRTLRIRPNSTALHLAVIFKKTKVVEVLLQHGADPFCQDIDGLTPLHHAFLNKSLLISDENSSEPCMRDILLPAYKSRNFNSAISEGLSHFHIACYINDLSLVKELLECGAADPEASINCALKNTNEEMPDVISSISDYTSKHNASDDYFLPLNKFLGYRALHMAVEGQALEVLDLLLTHGADAGVRNTAGLSPLQLALQYVSLKKRSRSIVNRLAETKKGFYDGLTRLHIVCLFKHKSAIEEALETDTDIDARLSLSSPIWPGSTALHLLLEGNILHKNYLEPNIKLLVNCGANVNERNSENLTPIHLAYNKRYLYANVRIVIRLMLESSRILESNPVDNEGFSHFHMACCFDEDNLVKEYLARNLANVNCCKDHFAETAEGSCANHSSLSYVFPHHFADFAQGSFAGYSPLHYAFFYANYAIAKVLRQHGANIHAKDRCGSTIFHVIPVGLDLSNKYMNKNAFLRYIDANTNMNAVDIYGRTPLEVCLRLQFKYADFIKFFLKNGARSMFVNPVTGEGLLSLTNNKRDLKIMIENTNDIADVDHVTGFNAIHNIVSGDFYMSRISSSELAETIEELISKGCDINMQDREGKTPLHVALLWIRNYTKVKTLLRLGADVNIVDNLGNTPLAYCKSDYNATRGLLIAHVAAILHFGLHLSAANLRLFEELCRTQDDVQAISGLRENILSELTNPDNYGMELHYMRKILRLEGHSLADLLSKTALETYPKMARSTREAIAECMSFRYIYCNFKRLGGLLWLQHRRCLIRMEMMEPAKVALQLCAKKSLSDFHNLPDLCSEIIISLLTNEDLKSLIKIIE